MEKHLQLCSVTRRKQTLYEIHEITVQGDPVNNRDHYIKFQLRGTPNVSHSTTPTTLQENDYNCN